MGIFYNKKTNRITGITLAVILLVLLVLKLLLAGE